MRIKLIGAALLLGVAACRTPPPASPPEPPPMPTEPRAAGGERTN